MSYIVCVHVLHYNSTNQLSVGIKDMSSFLKGGHLQVVIFMLSGLY